MAQELLRDRRFYCRDFARRERGYSLLFPSDFFIFSKNLAQTFVAGANSAASDQQCVQLDASGGAIRRPASAHFISQHCRRWASDPERSPRNKFVQSSSSLLLIFLRLPYHSRVLVVTLLLPMNSVSLMG